jgi:hypothetical protein
VHRLTDPAVRALLIGPVAGLLVVVLGCSDPAIDIGAIEQNDPPGANDLVVPGSEVGVSRVGLRATVTGTLRSGDRRKTYLLVSPRSNAATRDWWVQETVQRAESSFRGSCQFGEPNGWGRNEFFCILAVAADKNLRVGERLNTIPTGENVSYSKPKVVKRDR